MIFVRTLAWLVVGVGPLLLALPGCGGATVESASTDTGNPGIIRAERISVVASAGGLVVSGSAGAVPGQSAVTVKNADSMQEVQVRAEADGSFRAEIGGMDGDRISVRVTDEEDRVAQTTVTAGAAGPEESTPVDCPAWCIDPCDYCDATCTYFFGSFTCCDGDVCAATACPAGCTPTEFDEVQLAGAGTTLAQCQGECSFALELSNRTALTLTTSSTRIDPMRVNEATLTAAGRRALDTALAGVSPEALASEGMTSAGPPCEDCADSSPDPTHWLSLTVDGAITSESYTDPSAALAPVAEIVNRLRGALSECRSDAFVDVASDCRLPDPDGPQERLAEADAAQTPDAVCGRELHVVALDGAAIGYYNRSEIEATPLSVLVRVERPGTHVLVLSAYSAHDWTVYAEPGVIIERVIVNGYYPQTAQAPEGAAIEIHETRSSKDDLEAYAQDWPVDYQDSPDARVLVARVETLTGLPVTSYSSCDDGNFFTLHADGTVTGTCTEGDALSSHVSLPECSE